MPPAVTTLAALWSLAALPAPPAQGETLVLRGGKYLDLRAGVSRPNGAIVVRGGRIVALHPADRPWRPPAGAEVVELNGRTILPGLVDAHVHLTLAGAPEANAEATLRAGFTTVLDLGSADGGGARLRDAIAQGRTPGPRVIPAGSWIGVKNGVCEFGGATVRTAEEAAARARADVDAGAELLKVCVTGWPRDALAYPDSVELKAELLAAVLRVAREARRPVFAHAIGRAGALEAARGSRALAHTPIVDAADALRLKEAGVYVISTLATLTAGPAAEQLRRSFRLLHQAGVPIVLGTDAGVLPHGANARELSALVEAGLSPLEALRAATINARELLGPAAKGVGEISVGGAGDFVIVRDDPLSNLGTLERPEMVVQGGRKVVTTE